MKLIVAQQDEKKRPALFNGMVVSIVIIVITAVVGTKLLLMDNQISQVALILARVGFSLIPSAILAGAAFIVALWLAVLAQAWRA